MSAAKSPEHGYSLLSKALGRKCRPESLKILPKYVFVASLQRISKLCLDKTGPLFEHMKTMGSAEDVNGVIPQIHKKESSQHLDFAVKQILSETYVQKAWVIASKVLTRHDAPDLFPHFTWPGLSYYVYHDSSYWTSGFFPGIVWLIYARLLKRQLSIKQEDALRAARIWQKGIENEQFKTDNHDLGFMIMPSFSRDSDLTSSESSLEIVINAAKSLATRYDPKVKAIRSWAGARTMDYNFDADIDFVVVIDSLMNLDLLFYASQKTGDPKYAELAIAHADTTLKNHIRDNYSSYHLVNYDARDGRVQNRVTNQGYANESTWARGQAWALYGYATVYKFTGQERFLEAAIRIADYFLSRVERSPPPYDSSKPSAIVYWDFDAPRPGVWDVSAATCASSGLLLLNELVPARCSHYAQEAIAILHTVVTCATGKGDSLFDRSTMNDNPRAFHRTAEHGVVYADYYFLEAGNRLLDLQTT